MNKLRNRLNEGHFTIATRSNNVSAELIEVLAGTGVFDYIEFTAEYTPFTQPDLTNLARAAELHDTSMIIKVDFQNRFYVSQKAVVSGFSGVLFADHRTAEEVEESIYMLKAEYNNKGGLGMPSTRFISGYPLMSQKDFIQYCEDTVKIFMIEKQDAVENIEEICKVDGIDMIQFGAKDFSVSKGWNFSEHVEEVREAEKYCIEIALKNNVRPRAEVNSIDELEVYINLGVKDFCIGDDFRILRKYANEVCGKARSLISDRFS
ncbi:MAG TPA: 2,4-dihydroxyhept-2-ene-1,7-dioic acid aldolase [Clostridiaceae bacterium]|nr:2,4-dihydroxyhept-2-ene-1,7-dioic acid aldolase [Clostridiaceae bacterium]